MAHMPNFLLIEKAEQLNIDLQSTVLFVTLEPCIKRGPKKVPCAIRVAASKIPLVYIGTLDPDVNITGRGETYLSYHTTVDRFPRELAIELRRLNEDFFQAYRQQHILVPSLYSAGAFLSSKDLQMAERLLSMEHTAFTPSRCTT